MVIVMFMESDVKLSDDLLEAIVDKVSIFTNLIVQTFVIFSSILVLRTQKIRIADICRC